MLGLPHLGLGSCGEHGLLPSREGESRLLLSLQREGLLLERLCKGGEGDEGGHAQKRQAGAMPQRAAHAPMASSFSFSAAVPSARSFSIMLSPSKAFSIVLHIAKVDMSVESALRPTRRRRRRAPPRTRESSC